MGRKHVLGLALLGLLIAIGWLLMRRSLEPAGRPATVQSIIAAEDSAAGTGVVGGPAAPVAPAPTDPEAIAAGDVISTPADLEIFNAIIAWAKQEGLDSLEIGDAMARIGRRLVGAPYTPQTLETPGEERVVVNLREFDCVTYVENVLALARILRAGKTDFESFAAEVRRIRFRAGVLDGYVSRLHYFSEWIADNERKGLVRNITRELDGERDAQPIDFMSTHADAYPRLANAPAEVEQIRAIEQRLSAEPRYYIREDRIASLADRIRDGDIIAATSTVSGLDIAHTGLAIRLDGVLHLMHAPLVGKAVEISVQPLAERIVRIEGQDGIMVARPR